MKYELFCRVYCLYQNENHFKIKVLHNSFSQTKINHLLDIQVTLLTSLIKN
jgi:hypothetical protein